MAVGDRIKRARNFRGMTQKELGIAIGFEEKIRLSLVGSEMCIRDRDCGGTERELPFPL